MEICYKVVNEKINVIFATFFDLSGNKFFILKMKAFFKNFHNSDHKKENIKSRTKVVQKNIIEN